MDNVKYIGMDVHKEAISIAVLNSSGKLVMECTIETKASTILDFLKGLRGSLHVTLEEGTWAAWLYDLIKPHVTELVVCNPRRNALLKEGSKSDRIDAPKLAELLRANLVRSVYHGENGVRTLKELARRYLAISTDLIRVMSRVKAICRWISVGVQIHDLPFADLYCGYNPPHFSRTRPREIGDWEGCSGKHTRPTCAHGSGRTRRQTGCRRIVWRALRRIAPTC
jgi:Transposase